MDGLGKYNYTSRKGSEREIERGTNNPDQVQVQEQDKTNTVASATNKPPALQEPLEAPVHRSIISHTKQVE